MTPAKALLEVILAVKEAIDSSPHGIPAGHLYAHLMSSGCTLAQYQSIERILIESGRVTKRGDLLFPVTRIALESEVM